jgi:LmbE family N-acetylglucosaminyl deacetylase
VCEHRVVPGTIVSFHAHPDDEAIIVGGTLARAADAGHRVVLVFATRGEFGEVADGVLAPDEPLGVRREAEARSAAEILGAARVEFLGYRDSGMAGTPENAMPGAFASADVDEAADRLATILREEDAEVLTAYDERGGYEHPDHIQVHRVGVRAAQLAATPRVYAATVSREHYLELAAERRDELPEGVNVPDPADFELGMPDALITTRIDVTPVLDRKRAAMAAHASQIPPESFFLAIPEAAFSRAFGLEWFIRLDETPPAPETWLF